MRAAPLRIAYRALLDFSNRQSSGDLAPNIREWRDKVRLSGLHIVENFLPSDTCQDAVAEIDRLQQQYPAAVHHASRGADLRIFGADAASAPINRFASDAGLMALAREFLGQGAGNAFTLAGMITAAPDNLGSGEGWHRDAFFGQFKAILYLTDVSIDNGPFEYVLYSHHLARKYSDRYRHETPLHTTRITSEAVQNLTDAEPDRLRTICGKAGTLVLCDTTGIHRGHPIASGKRYALTNYYYTAREMTPAKIDTFRPVLGHHVPL